MDNRFGYAYTCCHRLIPHNPGDLYERFLARLELTPVHREALKRKRGFTDTTIDRFMLKSTGSYVAAIVKELEARYGKEILVSAKILFENNGKGYLVNKMLLEPNILIPYFNNYGEVTGIRPHKFGLPDVPVKIFEGFSGGGAGRVVLTEGEFKAIALSQWGIPALAVPGVASFTGKNFSIVI